MDEFIGTVIFAAIIGIFGITIYSLGAKDTEKEMKQKIVDEHRAEWMADEKGNVHFKWINAVEAK